MPIRSSAACSRRSRRRDSGFGIRDSGFERQRAPVSARNPREDWRPRAGRAHRRGRARIGAPSQPVPRVQRRVQPVSSLPSGGRPQVRGLEAAGADRSRLHQAVSRDDEHGGDDRARYQRVDGVSDGDVEIPLRRDRLGGARAHHLCPGRRGRPCRRPTVHPRARWSPQSSRSARRAERCRGREQLGAGRDRPTRRRAVESSRAAARAVRFLRHRGRDVRRATAGGADGS